MALLFAIISMVAKPAMAAPWVKAETAHFIIYSDARASEARAYARILEDYDAALRTFHRPADETAKPKFRLYLVSSAADFRRVFPEARAGIEGMYSAGSGDDFAVAVRNRRGWLLPLTGDHTVLHEYAHHFMHQHLQGTYPPWYAEGYAEYFAPTILGRTVIVGAIDAGRAYELAHEPWIPVSELLARAPSEISGKRLSAYYGQAWLLTHYIMDDPARCEALGRYLAATRDGTDPADAWQAAFGQTPQALERTLRAYLAAD
ncbi:MAG TPA: hypothetical protein VFN88_03290, partial [Caulobacteraceae bacterium]|nr:hypothetical protein [Caulobacteraceae bacterium]